MNEMLLVSPAKKNKTLLLMHMDKVGTRNYTDECGTKLPLYRATLDSRNACA